MDRERTDKRIDDLAKSVDQRFDQVDNRFDRFEASVDRRFDKADERLHRFEESVDARFDKVEGEMKKGFAAAAVQARAGSEKLDERLASLNHTVWAAIAAGAVVKLLFG